MMKISKRLYTIGSAGQQALYSHTEHAEAMSTVLRELEGFIDIEGKGHS